MQRRALPRRADVLERGRTGPRDVSGELGDIGSVARVWLNRVLPCILAQHIRISDVSILDVGCGNGYVAQQLTRLGARGSYLGCDLDVYGGWTDSNSEAGLTTRFCIRDAHELSMERGFNAVVSIMAFEHLDDDLRVLREIRRVVDDAAPVVIAVPAPASRLFLGRRHAFRWYTPSRLTRLAALSDFEVRAIVTQRSGPGLLFDAARVGLVTLAGRAIRAAAYLRYRNDRGSATASHPWLSDVNPRLHAAWLRLFGGRVAGACATAGLALDRLAPVVPVSHIAVLTPTGKRWT
jgi:SAM-dependent methyltransferase